MKIINWSEQGLIPGLLYFQNGGTHTGSVDDRDNKASKEFRYKIDTDKYVIKTVAWYGPYCYEKSDMVDSAEFTLDNDGHAEMINWIKGKYESMIE